ncbi:MAG: FixH family protein [Cyclonatronaceae bacterium]
MKTEAKSAAQKEWKWPLGIFLFYSAFVVATLSFVFFTFTQDRDLVVEEYYEATINYQEHIDRASNALALEQPLEVEVEGREVSLVYPPDMQFEALSGQIQLYRPSSKGMDELFAVRPGEDGVQQFSMADKPTGLWKLKINWSHNETDYYSESEVFIR